MQQISFAQAGMGEGAFRAMSPSERYRFLHDCGLAEMDSAAFLSAYHPLAAICGAKKDRLASWVLRYYYFQQRRILKLSREQTLELLSELVAEAAEQGFKTEELVARHYLVFEQRDTRQIPHEALYTAIVREFGQMEELGFERFRDYNLAKILKHSGMFMYELEDFEKALHFLQIAEQYIEPGDMSKWQSNMLVLNHIQSIYQQQKDYPKGIEYAQKILAMAKAIQSPNPEHRRWSHEWQGIASIDIASMLVGQQKFAEGESYADKGYQLVKATDVSGFQSEYDALLVLVPTKLELGKLDEAATLLQRMQAMYDSVGHREYYYFKNLRFFEVSFTYYEMKGDLAVAMHYAKLAKPLRDSLERRNDARKLEKITQRLEAEKYTERLELVESEKQLQTWLRNAALLIMLLTAALAYGNYRRLQFKRRQKEAELEAAKADLALLTNGFREKSELAENLRLENERLAHSGERSEYLEKLTHSTILTEEDWVRFRSVFEKVHPEFIAQLKTEHPDLTPAETRLLVLEKLDLNLQEMANMLGVSKNTIHQTRYRLRRKMEVASL